MAEDFIYKLPKQEEPVTEETVRAIVSSMQRTVNDRVIYAGGALQQSQNFVTGASGSGWRLTAEGDFEGNSGTFRGTITATAGTIGAFDIGSDYIRDVANSFGLASTVTGGDDVRFWAGDTYANRATADFFVTEAGAVTASNITITGGTVGASVVVDIGALNVAARGWTQTSVFSVTDADTIAWAAGTFTSADGTAYAISAGNTGNMAAKTYIYLDTAVSTTVYQTTTTNTTANGAGKVLIATAQSGTGEATFTVLNGAGGQNIDASSIVANSITANELSSSITYAGSIIVDTAGLIRSGQTAYNTGTGWWIGNDGGTPKLSIGNPAGSNIAWDGTNLTIRGGNSVIEFFTAGEALVLGNPVYVATTGTDSAITQSTNDGAINSPSSTLTWAGQTFLAPANCHGVVSVVFKLSKSGTPTGTLKCHLSATNAGAPNPSVSDPQATMDVSTLTGSAADYTFTFSSADVANMDPGVTYAIVLDTGSITFNGGDIDIYGSSASTYADGSAYRSTNGENGWVALTGDFYFTINVEATVAGRVYKTKATTATETTTWIGFCDGTVAKAGSAGIVLAGSLTGLSGLTIGSQYYLSNTQGAIGTSAGTSSRKVGIATATTKLLIRQDNP